MSEEVSEVPSSEVTASDTPAESKASESKEPEFRTVKIDGESVKVSLADLEKAYGLETSSRKRFEEASTLRKQVDEFLDVLQKGDFSSLKQLVPEEALLKFAEKTLRDKVEYERLDDSTKGKLKAEKERDEYKRKIEEQEETVKRQEYEELENKAAADIDDQLIEAISQLDSKYDKLVSTPEFIQDCARHMLMQLDKNGSKGLDPNKATKWALSSWKRRMEAYAKNLSSEDLTQYLSKKQINALRKSGLSKIEDQFPTYGNVKNEQSKYKKSTKSQSIDDWFATIDKRLGNG
jgi:hypothetical protein